VQTRRLTPNDRELARRAFVMMTRVFGDDGEPLSDDYLREILSRPDLWAVVAVSGDEPVGAVTAHVLPMTRAQTAELFVYDLAVRPDWQRRGVGRALLDHLITSVDPARISSVFVPADNDDTHALDFYRAVGGTAEDVTIFTFPPGPHQEGDSPPP
jgi:aminoglycoside 3-N-acetyltransferase I